MNGGNCTFNKRRDLHDVDQFGFIDITSAFESGSIPSFVEPSDDVYNGIDDPNAILGKPSDIFEAYRMNNFIQENSSSGGTSGSEASTDVPDKD